MAEQLRTLDKRRLGERIGRLPEEEMLRVDEALRVSLHLVKSERGAF